MSDNETLINVAKRIQTHANAKDDKFGFDPMTILAIVNIILTIIKIFYECRQNREAIHSGVKKPSLFYKLMLKRAIRKNFKDSKDRENVYAATLEVAAGLSEMEITQLIEEVEKDK
jgi:hypothetical protein